MFFIVQYLNEKIINKTNISNHWNSKFRFRIQNIFDRHDNLFRKKLKKFKNDIKMSIFFVNESNVFDLKQNFYFLTTKDKKTMNEIFDLLLKQNRIQKVFFDIFSIATSSIFVIWKNDKFKIVVDLKKINIKLYSNAYSLSRQNTIFNALNDFIIFFFVDLIKNFFQQNIKFSNWWKIIFVTFHRDQKWLTIFIMNLANTSDFFQHKMKTFLSSYFWQFVLMYIDDIIIYFSFFDQHIQHLNQTFTLLKNNDVTLTLNKCHFVYFLIQTLSHYVFKLELNIMKKKINVIRRMTFSTNFKNLKVSLKFFEYYKFFVKHFVNIVKSLIKLKIKNFKKVSIKNRFKKKHFFKINFRRNRSSSLSTKFIDFSSSTKSNSIESSLSTTSNCVETWKKLKKKLCITSTLVYSNFSMFFILYVDDNKKKNTKSFYIKSKKTR